MTMPRRDEQKAVDDEPFAITFIPDSSEASRGRATLSQEQRKDPFLSMIIDKLLTAEAVEKQLAQKQSDRTFTFYEQPSLCQVEREHGDDRSHHG